MHMYKSPLGFVHAFESIKKCDGLWDTYIFEKSFFSMHPELYVKAWVLCQKVCSVCVLCVTGIVSRVLQAKELIHLWRVASKQRQGINTL